MSKMETNLEKTDSNVDEQYWMSRAYELWKLLDDVDTAGDIAKSDEKLYRALVNAYQAKRWTFLDGPEVTLLYDMFHDPATDILGDGSKSEE